MLPCSTSPAVVPAAAATAAAAAVTEAGAVVCLLPTVTTHGRESRMARREGVSGGGREMETRQSDIWEGGQNDAQSVGEVRKRRGGRTVREQKGEDRAR